MDPDAARRLARQRDSIGHDIHETAQQAYELGLTWQEVGECLGRTSGGAHYIANHHDDTVG